MKITGLDIGTTGCKCTVFDEKGNYLGKAYRDYPVRRTMGSHEIDVSAIMEGVYAVIQEMTAQYPDIAGLGVTSFGETFVLADGDGEPLHPAMLYTDPRGAEECRELKEKIGEKDIARITGLRPHEMYSISKLMWMKKHQPEIYKAAKHVFLMEDYVVFHLTGRAQIDYSLASRTMAFDIGRLDWSNQILEAAGIDRELFSACVPTGSIAGVIRPEVAAKTGLPEETQIVSVSHDQVAAAVGAGAFDAKVAVDGAGTVECLTPIYEEMPDIDKMYEGYFSVVPYVFPGTYVAYAFSYTGGALMQWCVETFAGEKQEQAEEQGISVNELLEREYQEKHSEGSIGHLEAPDENSEAPDGHSEAPDGHSEASDGHSEASDRHSEALDGHSEASDGHSEASSVHLEHPGVHTDGPSGMLVLPHFAGAATPYMDTGSKGAILGLTTASTAADIYRGCMEGVVYEMYLNYQALAGSGIRFEKLNATGGGAHSAVWMQMKADVLNLPITALKTVDAGTVGCAMLTGVAIGLFHDLKEAAGLMVEETVTYKPRQEVHEKYMQVYERYRKVYDAVRPLM